ncbi:MAG: aspartyl-phosphate phosphatase Spo0E family protein [Acetivibrionales bacterium]|jgi:hypothetical protein
MLEYRIEKLKKELNNMVNEGLGSERVYKLSVKLDRLIVKYYKENNNRIK